MSKYEEANTSKKVSDHVPHGVVLILSVVEVYWRWGSAWAEVGQDIAIKLSESEVHTVPFIGQLTLQRLHGWLWGWQRCPREVWYLGHRQKHELGGKQDQGSHLALATEILEPRAYHLISLSFNSFTYKGGIIIYEGLSHRVSVKRDRRW